MGVGYDSDYIKNVLRNRKSLIIHYSNQRKDIISALDDLAEEENSLIISGVDISASLGVQTSRGTTDDLLNTLLKKNSKKINERRNNFHRQLNDISEAEERIYNVIFAFEKFGLTFPMTSQLLRDYCLEKAAVRDLIKIYHLQHTTFNNIIKLAFDAISLYIESMSDKFDDCLDEKLISNLKLYESKLYI